MQAPAKARSAKSNRETRVHAHAWNGVIVALAFALLGEPAKADCLHWGIAVVCADEYPGPPDCWNCEIWGSTAIYEPAADMEWWGYEWPWGYHGYFDVGRGVNLYTDHFNCEYYPTDLTIQVHVQVGSSQCLAYRYAHDEVVCSGAW